MRELGTKTTPVLLPSHGKASWPLLPSSVSSISGSPVKPENTYFHHQGDMSGLRKPEKGKYQH